MELPKRYDPQEAEVKWQKQWEKDNLYACPAEDAEFSIDTPPPTVSGNMHIGHACSYSQQDFYARYFRMKSEGKVFFPFGTDDNGLATERLVEKLKKVKSTKMSRKEFRELCHATVQEIKPEFVDDWKRIGMSCDFATTYSTISPEAQAVSQKSFLDVFKKGRAYKEEAPVVWCTTCQTAIAQAEFDNVELQSTFNDITFTCHGKDLVISTTRPEMIPACVALAAHPDDERYADLKGKFANVPLFDYDVPIIFDEDVEKDKGTGLMMVCTFGDKDDVEKWHKHKLPLRIIFTRDGKINDLPGKYEGMRIKEARKEIIAELEAEGMLSNTKQISHAVNVHERCNTEIEFLKTSQWYIRVLDIKEDLLEAGNKIKWHPAFMKKRYDHWVENLNWDWCISRQRFYGVPFPVWFNKKSGEIIVADEDQLPVDPFVDKPKSVPEAEWGDLIPEEDVMDTWATSSVSPQIALDWFNKPVDKTMPMTIRPQAHDIIRTWAFYTIVKAHINNNTIPWENIAVSGFVTDPHGKKMSKSKGNTVDPRKVIEQYGSDAVRFWSAGAKLGDDIPFQDKELVTGKKTITKLWNASKFVLMNLEGFSGEKPERLEVMDEWILYKVNKLVEDSTKNFDSYEHGKVKFDVEQFFWGTFCDNYLEIVKRRLYGEDEKQKASALYALTHVLETILKLFAPFMPYITEEIYQLLPSTKGSIHVSSWPGVHEEWRIIEAGRTGNAFVSVLADVRKHRAEKQLSMKTLIPKITIGSPEHLETVREDLQGVTNVEEIVLENDEKTWSMIDQEEQK